MTLTWVVAADSSAARIFAAESRVGPLVEIEDLLHPEGRLHEQELTSDLPGRAFDSAGQGRHAMETPVNPKKQQMISFAGQIADHLAKARNEGKFSQLIIVAPPAFLGELRKHFSTSVADVVVLEIDKNIEQQTKEQIRAHLPERLPVLSA